MKIAIGCDPNAQQAKEELIKFMEDKGYGEMLLPASMTVES